jgi:hypothetical protein
MTDAGNPDSDLVIRAASPGAPSTRMAGGGKHLVQAMDDSLEAPQAGGEVVNRLVAENENPREFAAPDFAGATRTDGSENRWGWFDGGPGRAKPARREGEMDEAESKR